MVRVAPIQQSRVDPSAERRQPSRFVTAASLFDGHDAAINIMRRMLQSCGAEVIHLGHNRSVEEVVRAAVQEDVHGVAVSSYQGGHMEYFRYLVEMLKASDGADIRVFGGGGGVIVPDEIRALEATGVARVYSPAHGQELGLTGIAKDMLERARADLSQPRPASLETLRQADWRPLARTITAIEADRLDPELLAAVKARSNELKNPPVIGVTGTGGAGKSSLTDELVRRLRLDFCDRLKVAIIAVDPSRTRTGGALLGDRIRMNAIHHPHVFMRSLATRKAGGDVPECVSTVLAAVRAAGFDLVILETPGVGQGSSAVVPLVDVSLYVMTPEFGAATQLEKIDMLDFADLVAINKFDRQGAQDALRDVRKQVQRNRELFSLSSEEMPVYATIASRFNDDGVTALYQGMLRALDQRGFDTPWGNSTLGPAPSPVSSNIRSIIAPGRQRYLHEIADSVRAYHQRIIEQSRLARERQQLCATAQMLEAAGEDATAISSLHAEREQALAAEARELLDSWPETRQRYQADEYVFAVRGNEIRMPLARQSLSGTRIPRIALPRFSDDGDVLGWLMREHLPGHFPFTAGVFPLKREGEDPSRMFAGEGDAFRTNERFKFLSKDAKAKRLSTAFDSVTLYGHDPDERPDVYGKVGNSGVSIATLDDMNALYDGFDLCDPATSVSMTINGPAPTILAMFLNTAVDQALAASETAEGRPPGAEQRRATRAQALAKVRGTVQADILKEDQGQNTCIFSTEFSLKMMGDIAEYFIAHDIRNFYSASISGYHIAEAGANPITQLAFTLANGFTYVEAYLARGMDIDDFAPNLSFFFSNGMDAEYAVLGRVARRIWAVTLRDKYGAGERAQKLKYHIQTSGRSLHAQEMAFNDIRTTLQALLATYDNCNSLHTNAYDEAVTTPTQESVRRALAIQMVINHEWGLAYNENPNQGSFVIEELTELVEEAVLQEFERLAERGGVLGAMETGYQRAKIQDESLHYEHLKHDGSLPIVGVNTFLDETRAVDDSVIELSRAKEQEKSSQLSRLRSFHARHAADSPAMLERLKRAVIEGENVFAVLMEAVRCCSLGQITQALFEVGGEYRRNM
jgi:methylmalonyl-CoA mutase